MNADQSNRATLPCPNPYCDGYGWIGVEATGTTLAYRTPACTVGPHPPYPVERFVAALPDNIAAAAFIAEVFAP